MSGGVPAVLGLGLLLAGAVRGGLQREESYLGSFQVEDSCQFQLCGPDYSEEFTAGSEGPKVGSCSGDCHLLATNINTNKFHLQFLWSQCSRMCGQKFPPQQYSQYKPRFVCMEQCYSSYSKLQPHHSLARYCIQAPCSTSVTGPQHQADCFSSCAEHVSSRVAEPDWQTWGSALAGECQQEKEGEQETRLSCADRVVWSHSSSSSLSSHCLVELCKEDIKCGRSCLAHVQAVGEEHRPVWRSCSQSVQCLASGSGERLGCADTCLQEHREQESRREQEESRRRSMREQQALLSVRSSSPSSLLLSPLLFLLLSLLLPD